MGEGGYYTFNSLTLRSRRAFLYFAFAQTKHNKTTVILLFMSQLFLYLTEFNGLICPKRIVLVEEIQKNNYKTIFISCFGQLLY